MEHQDVCDNWCPSCDLDFEADCWDEGKCPNCGRKYYPYEECLDDYSDCWRAIEWEPI